MEEFLDLYLKRVKKAVKFVLERNEKFIQKCITHFEQNSQTVDHKLKFIIIDFDIFLINETKSMVKNGGMGGIDTMDAKGNMIIAENFHHDKTNLLYTFYVQLDNYHRAMCRKFNIREKDVTTIHAMGVQNPNDTHGPMTIQFLLADIFHNCKNALSTDWHK